MAGVEKLIGVHGKMPTSHATTRGRHRERERSMANSPRRLSSMMRHGRGMVHGGADCDGDARVPRRRRGLRRGDNLR